MSKQRTKNSPIYPQVVCLKGRVVTWNLINKTYIHIMNMSIRSEAFGGIFSCVMRKSLCTSIWTHFTRQFWFRCANVLFLHYGNFSLIRKRYHRVEWPFSIIESPREGHLILHLLPRKMMNSFFNMLSFSTTSRYTSVFVICGRLRFFILPRCQMPVSATLTPYFQPLWLRCALHADVLYLQEAGLCWCRWCGWCCCCGGGGGRRRLQTAKLTPLFMPLTTLAHGKN